MAYTQYYKIEFTNEQGQLVQCKIYKNTSTPPGAIVDLLAAAMEINVTEKGGETGSIFNTIISRELSITLYLEEDSLISWDTFIANTYDEWKVTVETDEGFLFHGFIVPEQGQTPFQDKPYDVVIKATDGLKLLEGVELTDVTGSKFREKNTLIEYVSGALKKTLLDLNIRVYANIYHNIHDVRTDDPTLDMFSQTQLDYRTFNVNATEVTDCLTALEIILKEHFALYYYNGEWVIYRIPEFQFLANNERWYTVYNSNGLAQYGALDLDDYFPIGKNEIIYPVDASQFISCSFINKQVKHTYNYNVWDELPCNNKFERGVLDSGLSTATVKYYDVECWELGRTVGGTFMSTFPTLQATTGTGFRKSTYDVYGVEKEREIEITSQVTGDATFLMYKSEDIECNAGDIIDISFQAKVGAGGSPTLTGASFFYVILVPNDASPNQQLNNAIGTIVDNCPWVTTATGLQFLLSGASPTEYNSFSARSKPIPKDGKLYFCLYGHNDLNYDKWYYKDVQIGYTPYTKGGYLPIKGDYWRKENAANLIDKKEVEQFVSDSPKYVFKGALLTGPPSQILTSPQWYRYGAAGEDKHYKELVNRGAYNLTYRRFYVVQGDFVGFVDSPANDALNFKPISFHKKYKFVDAYNSKEFALVTPLRIDLFKAITSASFREVKDISLSDGTQEGAVNEFKYIFN